MGGEFYLEKSFVNQGSQFVARIQVQLPLSYRLVEKTINSTSEVFETSPISHLPLHGMKILVVDDSPDNQDLFKLILQKSGGEVSIEGDGLDAIARASHNDFDVILMDIQMPRMGGYEATMNLRNQGITIRIVALTAHAMKEEKEKALASGFTGYLSKPVQQDKLIETVAKLRRS